MINAQLENIGIAQFLLPWQSSITKFGTACAALDLTTASREGAAGLASLLQCKISARL
jgi:hypothetical protein